MIADLWEGITEAVERWSRAFYIAQFGKAERVQFYESLTGIIEDGVAIEDALETVARAYSDDGRKKHPVAFICVDVAADIRGGKSLGDACRAHIPNDETSLIEAGEETGNLTQSFRDCVRIIEARQRIGQLVRSVVLFPAITWGLMGALMYIISYFMVPAMSRRSDPESWTGVAAILYGLSTVVTQYGVVLVVLAVALVITSIVTLPYFCGLPVTTTSPSWRVQVSRYLSAARTRAEALPPWSLYKALQGAIFLLAMSVMLRSGINQLTALDIIGRSATPWLRERIDAIHYGVSSGKSFGHALKLAGHNFPDAMANSFLVVLAERRGFAESMERFANRWLEQTLKTVEAISKSMIAFSSMAVGSLMILVVIGMFQMTSSLMDSTQL